VALAARTSGKFKALTQAAAAFIVTSLLIPYTNQSLSLELLQFYSHLAIGVAGVATLYSAFDYIYANRSYVSRLLTKTNI